MSLPNIKVREKRSIARGTMEFCFEKPEHFDFRAGQFCQVTLIDPPETDPEGNTRIFSLATAPYEDYVGVATRMRDTAFKRVLRDLPAGSEVRFAAPYGDYTLHKRETRPAVFLIGGIGVTPVRSMVAQATHDKTAHEITLLHSNRTPDDAPFAADFEGFASVNPSFRFVQLADSAPDGFPGERGRIDERIVRKYVPDLAQSVFYLSGPEGMVRAMRQLLVRMAVDEDSIRTEEFAGY